MRPILFSIGSINIYAYGSLMACAFLISIFLARKHAKASGISADLITDLGIILLIFGIIGARIGYVLLNWQNFSYNLIDVIKVYEGGLVFSGGFLLAVLISFLYIKRKKVSFLNVADFIIPYVALAQSIGRIGCFLNGCCYGIPTTSFIGVKFPHLLDPVYPTQLILSVSLFLIFIILKLISKKLPFKGTIFLIYILLFSALRFFVEFIRADSILFFSRLALFQYVVSGVFIVSLAIFMYKVVKSRK